MVLATNIQGEARQTMTEAKTQTIDLPGATIDDQWTSETTGNHIVRIQTNDRNAELSYIIGQFQERGYVVNGVDFNRNEMSFAKEA